jgi:hypothetical protein
MAFGLEAPSVPPLTLNIVHQRIAFHWIKSGKSCPTKPSDLLKKSNLGAPRLSNLRDQVDRSSLVFLEASFGADGRLVVSWLPKQSDGSGQRRIPRGATQMTLIRDKSQ